MNLIPVFISFEFEKDHPTKERLIREWQQNHCPIDVKDVSLPGPVFDERWQKEAARRIAAAKVVLVICGRDTHNAKGVEIEVKIARQTNKPVLYLNSGPGASLPTDVAKETPMIGLDWKSLEAALNAFVK